MLRMWKFGLQKGIREFIIAVLAVGTAPACPPAQNFY
jgi:hypothetical protein